MLKTFLVFLVAFAATARAQATVEYGLGAGKAATTTAPAAGTGSIFDGLMERLQKVIQSAKPSSATETTSGPATFVAPLPKAPPRHAPAAAAKRRAPVPQPTPPPVYEDSSSIQPGIAYDELIRRFGPPMVAITDSPATRMLLYSGKDGRIELQVEDGKVISVTVRKPPHTAVTLPG